ncbi:hypothetical protein GCM10027418_22710 [Mariniluteicoccus endophyticus]
MTMEPRLTVDFEANAAYLQVSDAPVVETCEVAPGFQVDLDEFGLAVGFEVLDLSLDIPVHAVEKQYHLREQDVHCLMSIRPNVTNFVARQGGGVTVPRTDVWATRSALA